MTVLASCCCASCFDQVITNDFIYAFGGGCPLGVEYNFPAQYKMQMCSPVTPLTDTCTKAHSCIGTPDPLDCFVCGTELQCYGNVTECSFRDAFNPVCSQSNSYLTGSTCGSLIGFKWNGPLFGSLEKYTHYDVYGYGGPECANQVQQCSSSTEVVYVAAVGNAAWATGTQTNSNLTSNQNDYHVGKWGKFYDGIDYNNSTIPNNIPRDECKWIIGAAATNTMSGVGQADTPPAFCGYKFSQQIDHPATATEGAKVSNTYMSFGYARKTSGVGGSCDNPGTQQTPSLCPEPCVDPCFCSFLRVRVQSNLKKASIGQAYTQLGGTGYYGAWGYNGIYFGGPYPFWGDVSTIAYYRKYWDGKESVQNFMSKPMDLYQVQGGACDIINIMNPPSQQYTFRDSNNTRGTIRNYDFASSYINQSQCSAVTGCGARCVSAWVGQTLTCTLYSIERIRHAPVGQGSFCCTRSGVSGSCDCDNYVATFCSNDQYCTAYSKTTCTSCPGEYPGYTDHSCKVCTNSRVVVFTNKTAPGGQKLTQGDINSMPCDWENLPLTITPVFNPSLPIVESVKTKSICGLWVTPPYGPLAGNTPLLITGCHLLYSTEVKIAGVPCPFVKWLSNSEVLAHSPPSTTTGAKPVLVTNSVGTSAHCGINCNFTYYSTTAPGAICSSNNLYGPCAGGNYISIIGMNLALTTQVTIGGLNANFAIISDAELRVRVPAIQPAGIPGVRTIYVISAAGSSGGASYTYQC